MPQELSVTTLYVTHDQTEAMTLGDRIALLRQGQLVQLGTPQQLDEQPATPFVATFVGSPPMNLLPATWEAQDGQLVVTACQASFPVPEALVARLQQFCSRDLLLGIRPEHLSPTDTPQHRRPGRDSTRR